MILDVCERLLNGPRMNHLWPSATLGNENADIWHRSHNQGQAEAGEPFSVLGCKTPGLTWFGRRGAHPGMSFGSQNNLST